MINVSSKDELRAREGFYIKSLSCVNRNGAGRTPNEYNLDNKEKILNKARQYHTDNREIVLQRLKKYHTDNKEKEMQYRIDNKDKIQKRHQLYCELNREDILKSKKEYYINHSSKVVHCECDASLTLHGMPRHIKTMKHQTYLQNNINTTINETD